MKLFSTILATPEYLFSTTKRWLCVIETLIFNGKYLLTS
jgi:hypothetical protein